MEQNELDEYMFYVKKGSDWFEEAIHKLGDGFMDLVIAAFFLPAYVIGRIVGRKE